MKEVILSNLNPTYLQEWTLSKKVDNDFSIEEIESECIFDVKADFDVLLDGLQKGEDKETGTVSFLCGEDEITKDVHIKHNEGKFSIKECRFTKPLRLTNILDCVINETISIFEYTASTTGTIQGNLEKESMYFTGMIFKNFRESITLNEIFAVLGNVPDRSVNGFYPEYIYIRVLPNISNFYDDEVGEYIDHYNGHDITMEIIYMRITSAIQHNYLWKQIPGGTFFFYSGITNIVVDDVQRYTVNFYEGQQLFDYYEAFDSVNGAYGRYNDIPISNTFYINEILIDIFRCTGLTLVSDFLGINPDGTNPTNTAYTFAANYCQNIKICQSFDIIRESAAMDSFGKSGTIKVKDFLSNILKMFNLVVAPGTDSIRIEHKSYFINKGIDPPTRGIEYEIEEIEANKELIDAEEFSFAVATPTENFYKVRIDYDRVGLYREENVKQIQVEKFLTDIFGTINNELFNTDEFKPLFFLLSTQDDEVIGLNTQFSMLEIVNNLHQINRPTKRGSINGAITMFETFSVGMETDVKISGSIKMYNALFPYNSILLKEGTFMIKELSLNDKDELIFKVVK